MMDLIRSLVKKLLMFLLFETITSQLLAHTAYEKYAKMFTGLLLILIMLSPVISAFKLWDTLDWNVEFAYLRQERDTKRLEYEMESLEEKTGFLKEYRRQLKSGISEWFSQRGGKVTECSLRMDKESGEVKEVGIIFTGKKELEEEVLLMLENTFGLKKEQVDIKWADADLKGEDE